MQADKDKKKQEMRKSRSRSREPRAASSDAAPPSEPQVSHISTSVRVHDEESKEPDSSQ